MKILVVEDVYLMRSMLENFLQPISQIDFAQNGMDALDFYLNQFEKNEPYDLICLDILLPQLDGLEVLKEIRKHEKEQNIPKSQRSKIIMISTLSDRKMVMRSINSGCDGYIAKPFSKKRILDELVKLKLYNPPVSNQ